MTWKVKGRPKQFYPKPYEDWFIWCIRTGRGWGKNYSAGNNFIDFIRRGWMRHVALVGPTTGDIRDFMIDPDMKNAGLMAIAPKDFYPKYEPSKRQLVWPNGAIMTAYSAEDSEQLRGPSHDGAWCDEIAAWNPNLREQTWSNLMFTLRIGNPHVIVTSTPKPINLIKRIEKGDFGKCVVTRGSTHENMSNLSQVYIESVIKPYMGTRIGLQEIEGEILEDNDMALFDMKTIENNRVEIAPDMDVINVGVDPMGSKTGHGCGIVVSGKAGDYGYAIDDYSLDSPTPNQWALQAIKAYEDYEANYIVVETNYGGDMVANTIRLVCRVEGIPVPPIREVKATRGKTVRAEPISMLAHQNRIKFVGVHSLLEDQLYDLESGQTDDRADAFIWTMIDLLGQYVKRLPVKSGNAKVDRPQLAYAATSHVGNIWNKVF